MSDQSIHIETPAGSVDLVSGHIINGVLQAGTGSYPVINPATGEAFAYCADAPAEILDTAVAAATVAQRAWAGVAADERVRIVRRIADAIRTNSEELARIITLEQGKTLAASRGEVSWAADCVDYICSISIAPKQLHDDRRGRAQLIYKPLGVIGAITPWNVPVGLAVPKIVSALYAGNAVVLKPSTFTPFSMLKLGSILQDVLPAGLLNVVAGSKGFGQALCEHPGIAKINFTGSVETGKSIMRQAAGTLKRLTLELGGNDAAIVLADADPKAIARKLFFGAFGLSGQVCMGIKRLYVHQTRFDETVDELAAIAKATRVGDGFDPEVTMGPVQNQAQFDTVMHYIEDTNKPPGAETMTGGYAYNRPGYFIAPTIVTGVAEGARLVDEEQFGPVLPVMSFESEDEAIDRANRGRLGLGGSIWTSDIVHGTALAARLDTGFTWVNHHVGTTRDLPFGGFKDSGIGRQGGEIGVTSDMEAQVVLSPA